jgi:uncharacterized protein YceK
MRYIKVIMGLVGLSTAALSGCAADASAVAPAEEATDEAASAEYGCPWGSQWVYEAGTCVSTPYTYNASPGAYGCALGAVLSGRGNVVCFIRPSPYANPYPYPYNPYNPYNPSYPAPSYPAPTYPAPIRR